MAFLTIHLTPDLTRAERARARQAGPRAVDTRGEHGSMLDRAGFDVVLERDATGDFLHTARAWLRESAALAHELTALEPEGGFDQRQQDRRTMIAAIEDGLLRRRLYVAIKRGATPRPVKPANRPSSTRTPSPRASIRP